MKVDPEEEGLVLLDFMQNWTLPSLAGFCGTKYLPAQSWDNSLTLLELRLHNFVDESISICFPCLQPLKTALSCNA